MQFMALIYGNADLQPQYGTDEFKAMMQGYFAANEVFKRDGVFVAGEPLQGVDTATSLRIRGGKTETMDGPFAETKETLGGFYIFDCADLDAALKYAAMIPGAKYGTVEVRPIMQLS
ncbi:MAG: YciI family protein [Rhodobacteraceae bacterium]|nr:YciI family protein [Paracoccaceae bacterium]